MAATASAVFFAAAVAAFTPLPLERIYAEPPVAGRPPMQAQMSPAGRYVTYLKASEASQEVLDLWAQPLPTGAPLRLVSAADLLGGAAQKLSEAEKMALERKRISQRGITSYSWCGADDSALLFPFSGDLYVARLVDGKAPLITRLTNDDDVPEQNPTCSGDGKKVAFVKAGNVMVLDVKTKAAPITLTRGSGPDRTFGLAEFIAEEELSRHKGFWWSPNGQSLLVFEVDERPVGVKVRPQIFADRTEMVSQRYPAAGENNAVVIPHLIDLKTKKPKTIRLGTDVEYIARAGFFDDGRPWLQVLTRDQTRLTLLEIDPKTAKARVVTQESDAAWVEVHDDLHELPADGGARAPLLWPSEQAGKKELVAVERTGGNRTPYVAAAEAISEVVCVGGGRVVFGHFDDRGRAHQLSVREANGAIRALTSGAAHHTASADAGCATLLVTTSKWGVPPTTSVVAVADGKILATIGDATDAADPILKSAVPADARFVDVKAADGVTILNALWLPPAAMKAGRKPGSVPVITYAYGGPTGQVVAHRWSRMFPVFTRWQQLGFGVFIVDTRGMAGRDRAFTRAHKMAFGKVEVDDVKAAIRQLPGIDATVDAKRVGFFGWSYGGYLAARLVLDDDTPVAAAVATAPVTDWRLYDTAYTERYLGLPAVAGVAGVAGVAATGDDAYAQSNLVTRAKLLSKPLLLMHGTADDNVLFENTLRLVSALEDEGKVFDLAIYPGKAHGISGTKSQLHVYKTITAYFTEKLKP
jgi:dipeptidyl-peptidase-4